MNLETEERKKVTIMNAHNLIKPHSCFSHTLMDSCDYAGKQFFSLEKQILEMIEMIVHTSGLCHNSPSILQYETVSKVLNLL